MRAALFIALTLALATPTLAQEFFTLKGHGGPIMDIDVSPEGQIATASFDNSVGLWEGAEPRWLEGSRAAVNTVLIVHQFGWVLAGGDDFTFRAWNTETGESGELGTHTAKITDIDFHPGGLWFASASWDATIGLWPGWENSSEPIFLRGHENGVNDVVFGNITDGELYSASADGTIRVWDLETKQEKRRLVKHGFGVNTLVLNEADGWLAYGAVDGGTRMIDIETGEPIADFTLDRRPILAMDYHAGTHQLAVGDGQGYIMVIDTEARKITRDFRAARNGPIWALAFSPDGQNIHAGGIEDIVYSWPVATMDEHGPMSDETRSFLENPEELPNGERQFKRKCSICHTLTEGSARKAGPSLHRLFGRRAGTVTDYTYSDTLEGSEIIWDEDTINALFDEGPDHYIPGTKMPMQRIVKPEDRQDLIAYLRTATAPEGD